MKLIREGNTLVVRVVENPIINRIAFEGNSKISDKDLNAEVQARARVVYTRTRVQNDVRRIIELYRRQGRFAATVEPKIIQLPENRVDVVFEINEGPPTGIRGINFVGNRKFGDSTLRGVIETKESRWYRFLSTSDTYDPDRVAYDRELLRKFYLSEGYADFRVVSAVAELTPDRDAFILTFTVDEGERYRFGNVDVDIALKDLPREAVLPLLTVRPDEWYNAEAVERSITLLTDALGNRGYAFVEIRPEITRNREAHTVDIVFRVQEGPRVYVERIDITGNIRTLDKVIRREFRLVEGDPFNTTRMQRSKERIQNLGFFKKVDVSNVPGSAPDRTVIVVDVEEQSTGELSLGARLFHLRRAARRYSRTRAKFPGSRPGPEAWHGALVPLATGRYQLHGTVFSRHEYRGRRRSVRDQDQPDQQFLHRRHAGVSTDLLWRLAACGLSDHRRSAPDLEVHRSFRQYHRCCEQRLAVHSAAGGHGARHPRSARFCCMIAATTGLDPTDGYFASIGNDFAGVGFGVQYLRNKANVGYYYSIAPQWVLSVTGEAGYIFGWGGDPVFLQDSFFVGGDNLRGFAAAGIGPRDIVSGDALGGNKYYHRHGLARRSARPAEGAGS